MHSMLFVATTLTFERTTDPEFEKWRGFLGYAKNSIDHLAGVERLGENVWLMNMRIDPLPLILLGSAAHEHDIAFRLLPFDDAPQWLPDGSRAPA
jgi:hypothetical protein